MPLDKAHFAVVFPLKALIVFAMIHHVNGRMKVKRFERMSRFTRRFNELNMVFEPRKIWLPILDG